MLALYKPQHFEPNVLRSNIRTLRDPFSNKPYVGFYSTKRVGGIVKDKAAFVFLKVSA